MLIPTWAYAAAAATTLAAGFGAGWTVRDWKADSDQLDALTAADKRVETARQQGLSQGAAYAQFQAANAERAAADRTTIRETYREIRVPADCAVPSPAARVLEDGLRRANAAAAGEPGAAMPGVATTAAAADRP